MKHARKWVIGLTILSVIITAILMLFMPEQIPVHYNSAGLVDRMGSKLECLIWPALTAFMGGLFLLMQKKGKTPSEKKIFFLVGVVMQLFFMALGIYFMAKSVAYDPSMTATDINTDVTRIATVAIGIVLIVLGNFMPKISRNKLFGLRTSWTLSSDTVWQKSNRFCGICGVVCGLSVVLAAVVLPSPAALIACILLFAAWIIASIIGAYRYYKAEQRA